MTTSRQNEIFEAVPVFVVAEAGVNHNGDAEIGAELVRAAKRCGADAVKFQSFVTDELVTKNARTAEYQGADYHSQWELLRDLELTHDDQRAISQECKRLDIEFISTPFDVTSLKFLIEDLSVTRVKIASPDLTNGPILLAAARTERPLIISTGMANLEEIETALGVVAFGITAPIDVEPSLPVFRAAYSSPEGRRAISERVTLLHCTSAYPAPVADVNLRAMRTIADTYGIEVGYSDHTLGIAVSVAAVALGACVIEKHLTLDKTLPGPDHRASLEPEEFRSLVESIRTTESALGSAEKRRTQSELELADLSRRSLVAARPLRRGDEIDADDIGVRRPGTGRSPMDYWEVLGSLASQDYEENEFL